MLLLTPVVYLGFDIRRDVKRARNDSL